MCVRTKTSYGCGHAFKDTVACDTPGCTEIDRYHLMKEGDCQACKKHGATATRGRDGMGRYAQKMKKSRPKDADDAEETAPLNTSIARDSLGDAIEASPVDQDISGTTSPWAATSPREKVWGSPHRLQADEAWLSEHGDRMSDLQEKLEGLSVGKHRKVRSPSRRHVYEPGDSESDREQHARRKDHGLSGKYHVNINTQVYGDAGRRAHSDRSHRERERGQARQHSHDSLPDSMPSYRSSPRVRRHLHNQHSYPERNEDFDFYTASYTPPRSSRHHHHGSKAKAEPYMYTPSRPVFGASDSRVSPVVLDDHHGCLRGHKATPQRYDVVQPRADPYVRYQPRY